MRLNAKCRIWQQLSSCILSSSCLCLWGSKGDWNSICVRAWGRNIKDNVGLWHSITHTAGVLNTLNLLQKGICCTRHTPGRVQLLYEINFIHFSNIMLFIYSYTSFTQLTLLFSFFVQRMCVCVCIVLQRLSLSYKEWRQQQKADIDSEWGTVHSKNPSSFLLPLKNFNLQYVFILIKSFGKVRK